MPVDTKRINSVVDLLKKQIQSSVLIEQSPVIRKSGNLEQQIRLAADKAKAL